MAVWNAFRAILRSTASDDGGDQPFTKSRRISSAQCRGNFYKDNSREPDVPQRRTSRMIANAACIR